MEIPAKSIDLSTGSRWKTYSLLLLLLLMNAQLRTERLKR